MFREDGGRPGDRRGFLHKSFIGRAVGGVVRRVAGATPVGQVVQTGLSIIKGPARNVRSRTETARPSASGQQGKEFGRNLKFGGDSSAVQRRLLSPGITETACRSPRRIDPRTGECRFFLGDESGRDRPPEERGRPRLAPPGDAVMGQFGAALEPGVMTIERSVCIPGMQLGKDGLCYNKGAITNSQRMWPRGRRPLLTGGDMRAIGIAARAGSKVERTVKRLRGLGMMKQAPKPRAGRTHQHAKPVAAVSI